MSKPPCPPASPMAPSSPSQGCFRKPSPHKEQPLCSCHTKQRPLHHTLGVIFVVLGYTFLGAVIFMLLEGEPNPETSVAASKPNPRSSDMFSAEIRSKTVDKLWSITEDLNILYRENWTRLAAREVLEFQERLLRAVRKPQVRLGINKVPHRWTYASSFLYALTLITTIGYGGVSPRTTLGRCTAMVYAVIGIPLVLCYLSALGEALANAIRRLCARLHPPRPAKPPLGPSEKRPDIYLECVVRVPISACLLIVIMYVGIGAAIFRSLEGWTVLEGTYFCFTSLGTIGFGDLIPGNGELGELSLCICSLYILLGMAVIATCFNLMQTEVMIWFRKFSTKDGVSGGVVEDIALVGVTS